MTATFSSLHSFISRPRGRCALLAGAIALGTPVPAQVLPPVHENVVVTATLSPEEESELGAATTVIDRKRIEESGATTVLDLLRLVPGLDVVRSGGDGAVTSIFLRGANSTQTLVLVDGVRVNSPYFSGYDFSALTTENVERVEVVRGPFSSLYGSDAMGGVVQVFTRPATQAPAAEGALEAGSAALRGGSVFLSSGEGPLSATASYRHASVDGDRANSDWAENNGSVRLEASLGERIRAALEGSVLDGESGVPGPVGAETPFARGTFREDRVALPISFEPAKGHDASFVLAHVRSRPTFRDPSDPLFGSSDTDARSLEARAADRFTVGGQRLTAFASWEKWMVTASGASGPFIDGEASYLWGAGIQDSVHFVSRVFATLGLGADRHSDFGGAGSPRSPPPGSPSTPAGRCAPPRGPRSGPLRSASSTSRSSGTLIWSPNDPGRTRSASSGT